MSPRSVPWHELGHKNTTTVALTFIADDRYGTAAMRPAKECRELDSS